MVEETRVRMGIKQAAKGAIQLDLTAEAPTVDKAAELLDQALKDVKAKIAKHGLQLVGP